MICEIVSVGTELLMGQIANTDAQYLSRRLPEMGIYVYRHTVVGDNPGRVRAALTEAFERCDLVITTGGLGPTEDDLTKEMVAEYAGRPLVEHAASLKAIERFARSIGGEMTENVRKQALFPEGAVVLANNYGTAPGFYLEFAGKSVAVLPGPPRELKPMFDKQLCPLIAARGGQKVVSRFIRTVGIREAVLENELKDLFHSDDPTLALYCGSGQVMARISARADTEAQACAMLDRVETEIRRRVGEYVYGTGAETTITQVLLKMLTANGETVCFAESCTGGRMAAGFIDEPGSSAALRESYITYADEAKRRLLGVSGETLDRFSAVSEACAREMAEGARRRSGATWAVSATGYAGPDGGTQEDPAGTVYLGVSGPERTVVRRCFFNGDRDQVRTLASVNGWDLLRREMLRHHAG